LRNGYFRIALDGGHETLGYTAGKMRRYRIRIFPGDRVKIELQVCAMVPQEEWTGLSLRLILHGRRVCIARRPRCEECVLNDFCPSSLTRPKPRRRKLTV